MAESKWKVLLKPIFTWCLNRVQVVFYMDFIFQNIQSFLFLIKLVFHKIYLRKGEQSFWFISFSLEKKGVSFQRKKNRVLWVCVIENFQAWHHRTSFVPCNSLSKKHCSKVNFSSLLSEWILSKSRQTRTVCVQGVLDV